MTPEERKESLRTLELTVLKRVNEFCALTEEIESRAQELRDSMSPTRASVLAPDCGRVKPAWVAEIRAKHISDKTYNLIQAYHAVQRAKRELERLKRLA